MMKGKFEKKRFFGLLLAIVMLFSIVPQGALAVEGTVAGEKIVESTGSPNPEEIDEPEDVLEELGDDEGLVDTAGITVASPDLTVTGENTETTTTTVDTNTVVSSLINEVQLYKGMGAQSVIGTQSVLGGTAKLYLSEEAYTQDEIAATVVVDELGGFDLSGIPALGAEFKNWKVAGTGAAVEDLETYLAALAEDVSLIAQYGTIENNGLEEESYTLNFYDAEGQLLEGGTYELTASGLAAFVAPAIPDYTGDENLLSSGWSVNGTDIFDFSTLVEMAASAYDFAPVYNTEPYEYHTFSFYDSADDEYPVLITDVKVGDEFAPTADRVPTPAYPGVYVGTEPAFLGWAKVGEDTAYDFTTIANATEALTLGFVALFEEPEALDIALEGISVTPAGQEIKVGQGAIARFTVNYTPADANDIASIEWTIEDPTVAAFYEGSSNTGKVVMISAVKEGTTKVNVKVTTTSGSEFNDYARLDIAKSSYSVTYHANYPANAQKLVYRNGNGSAALEDAVETTAGYEYTPNTAVTVESGLALANYDFVAWATDPDGKNLVQPGDVLTDSIASNVDLYAVWGNAKSVSTETITVWYTYPSRDTVEKSVLAIVNTTDKTATFVLANAQDTHNTSNHSFRGWTVNSNNYGFNDVCTAPYTGSTAKRVTAAAWIDKSNSATIGYAQFFVLKPGYAAIGNSANYHSVGVGSLDEVKVQSKIASITGSNIWGSGTAEDHSGDVGEYLLETPSARTIADLLGITVSEAASVRWYVIKDQGDGYHVDGVIADKDRYWNVNFYNDNGKLIKRDVVKGGDPYKFDADLSNGINRFQGWYDSADADKKSITQLDYVTRNHDIYPKVDGKVIVSGSIDNGFVSNSPQSITSGKNSEAIQFRALTGYYISEVWVKAGDKAATKYPGTDYVGATTFTYPAQKNVKNNILVTVVTKLRESVIVTVENKTKTYGDDDPAFTVSVTAKEGSKADAQALAAVKAYLEANGRLTRVAGEDVTAAGYVISVTDVDALKAAFPQLKISVGTGKLRITPKELTITAKNYTREWTGSLITVPDADGDNGVLSVSPATLPYGDVLAGATASGSGTDVNTTTGYSVKVNTSDITIVNGDKNVRGNYTFRTVDGKLLITAQGINLSDVKVDPESAKKIYGTLDSDVVYALDESSLPNGWTLELFEEHFAWEVTRTNAATANATAADKAGKDEDVNENGYTLVLTIVAKTENYVVSDQPSEPGKLTIIPRELEPAEGKHYVDYGNDVTQAELEALVNYDNADFVFGEDVTDITPGVITTLYTNTSTAGEYPAPRENGSDANGNYIVWGGTGTIIVDATEFDLSGLTAIGYKTYGSADPVAGDAGYYVINGWPTGNAAPDINDFNFSFERADASYAAYSTGEDAGLHKTVTITVSPKIADTYEITQPAANTGTLDIKKAALVFQIDKDVEVEMNDPAPANLTSLYKLIDGEFKFTDTETSVLGNWNASITTDYTAGAPADTYDIVYPRNAPVLTNYTVEILDGLLIVKPIEINVGEEEEEDPGTPTFYDATLRGGTKVYGTDNPNYEDLLTWNPLSKANPDHFDITVTRTDGEKVSDYTITATVKPKEPYVDSYTVNGAPAKAIFTITPATLTPVFDPIADVAYGDSLDLNTVTYLYDGYVQNAGLNINDNAGNVTIGNAVLSTAYKAGDTVGTYDVDLSAGQTENYIVKAGVASFNVVAKTLNLLEMDFAVNDETKIYGNSDPAFRLKNTWPAGFDISQFQVGFNRIEGENVGDYTINATVTPLTNNYRVEEQAEPGTLTITPRAIVLHANDYTITAGDDLPEFIATLESGTLVPGDQLLYSLYAVGYDGTAGSYVINFNLDPAATLNRNYSIQVIPGTLTVTAAADTTPVTPITPATPGTPVTPAAPAAPVAPTPAADPAAPAPVVTIPEDPTPTDPGDEPADEEEAAAPVVDIDDNDTPTDPGTASWALWNLILTILTGVIMLVTLIWYFVGKKKKDEEDDPYQRQRANSEQEDEQTLKRRGIIRLLTIIPTIVAIIVFILTEDMRLPMVMTDQYTIWMAVIAIVQVVLTVFTKKKRNKPEDEQMDKAQPQGF
ncbi:hypothetical protein LJC56_08995 [Christensenellaceae bacterium OttesenSCG-928-K19]|nr:hypothetical protein [Christensenellaceae bacterium OttesenSCG-928-K19]